MQWLLVVMVFDIGHAGEFLPKSVMHKAFTTEEACNAIGQNFRDVIPIPEGTKTFSVCIPRSMFDEKNWKIVEVE